jgi:hypothetical protein
MNHSSPLRQLSRRFSHSPSNDFAHISTGSSLVPKEDDGDHQEAFGLFQLNNETTALPPGRLDSMTATYNADIIAIHGLGGTAYKTWTHANGKLWLRDFAPNEFPGSRIYTFGYDSGYAFSKGAGTLTDFASSLLTAIQMERTTPEEVFLIPLKALKSILLCLRLTPMKQKRRPIIFVCHSMGGIVAKLVSDFIL